MLRHLPERRLLAYYEDDDVPWHHRMLLEKIHGTAYILATPHQEIPVQDVALLTLRPVARNPAFPDVGGATYVFDRVLSEERLADLREEGRMLDRILGAAATAAGLEAGLGAAWLVADPANEPFENLVPMTGHSSPDQLVTRGSLGLAKIDGEWMFFERGGDEHTPAGREDERPGASGDPFPGPSARLADGSPSAPAEPPTGIVTSGNDREPYHQHGARNSGIPPHAGIAIEHDELLTILAPAICFDLLNVVNLASAEQSAWCILMLERAVKRSQMAPDFEGPATLPSDKLGYTGGVLTRLIVKYISKILKKDATVLKRQRLYGEKAVTDTKRKKGKYGPRDEEGGAE